MAVTQLISMFLVRARISMVVALSLVVTIPLIAFISMPMLMLVKGYTQASTLKILLVSDEHENWANLDLLMAREEPSSFDFVFMSGDQANCRNRVGEAINEEENWKCEASNQRFVQTLSGLHKPEGKLYFIPGNHDAEVLLDSEKMLPINNSSVNLHN